MNIRLFRSCSFDQYTRIVRKRYVLLHRKNIMEPYLATMYRLHELRLCARG